MDQRALRNLALLPEAARSKLSELQLARMSCEDAARSASARLAALPRDADQQLQARLAAERDKHSHKHAQLSQLLSRVQQWIMELRPGTALEMAAVPAVELNGEKVTDALARVRAEIAAAQRELSAVRRAPLPLDEMRQLAQNHVVGLMRQGAPTVTIQHDELKIAPRGDVFSVEDSLALLAWAAPEQLYRAIVRELERLPARADALSADQRKQRLAELAEHSISWNGRSRRSSSVRSLMGRPSSKELMFHRLHFLGS
jgi:hypothetical protein